MYNINMFPAETSLIPVFVSLVRYFESGGWQVFGQNYPFWYMGTTPFRYLAGPIGILLANGLHQLIPLTSLFNIVMYMVIFSLFTGLLGWLTLLRKVLFYMVLEKRNVNLFSFIFVLLSLFLPWKYLNAFCLGNGTATLAGGVLPWLFVTFWLYFKAQNKRKTFWFIFSIFLTAVILLIESNALLSIIIGAITVGITASLINEKYRKVGVKIKRVLGIIAIGFVLATIWYGFGYWVTILGNPSIGGASGVKVIGRVIGLFRYFIPILAAFGVIYFNRKLKQPIYVFLGIWLMTFMLLTFFRFIGDPDFWQDWTIWLTEIEIGLVGLVAYGISYLIYGKQKSFKWLVVSIIFLIIPFGAFYLANRQLKCKLIVNQPPASSNSVISLAEIAGTQRVFMSGSSVFWANALTDLYQVRGGKDFVAKDNNWAKASYTVREGDDINEVEKWLNQMDIKYVLIHTDSSSEYYHDFKNQQIWGKLGKIVWSSEGDVIYSIYK